MAKTTRINAEVSRVLFDAIVFTPIHIVKDTYKESQVTIEFSLRCGDLTTGIVLYKNELQAGLEKVKMVITDNLASKTVRKTLKQ